MVFQEGYIITEESNKNVILKNNANKILNYTFLNLKSLIELLTFKVEKEAIAYLSINKKIEPKIAKMYVDNLKYDKLFFDNDKLNKLSKIKKELEENGFITYDKLFINYLKKTPITFVGYLDTKELRFALNILEDNNIKYEIINFKDEENKIRDVYEFKTIAFESRFVFNKIKELLDSGINIDKIKIANYSNEYDYDFKRLSNYYKIPVNFNADKNILSTDIAHTLFTLIDENLSFDDIIFRIKKRFISSPYIKKIINIINSYKLYHYESKLTKCIFIYEFKNMTFNKITYENGIELINFETYASQPDEYIFYLGFNLGKSPLIFKDTEYLDDKLKIKLNLDTSDDLNNYAKEDLKRALNRDTNFFISYKLKSTQANYIASSLINELNYNIKKVNYNFGFNANEDRVVYSIALDEYNKFGTIQNDFTKTIYDINYQTYDNKFNGIDAKKMNDYFKTIKLSYTSLTNYYECPFKYYLNYILNVPLIYKNTSADLGTYAHEILENSYKENFDFEKASDEALNNVKENLKKNQLEFNDRDLFFSSLIKNLVKQVIEFNKEYEDKSDFDKVLTEPKLTVSLDDGKLIFEGKVDKILYKEKEDRTIFAVIDYKTGNNIDVKLSNLDDGLHTQLPIYYYLVKNSKEITFKNPDLIGLYYHKISVKDTKLKLDGFTKEGIANALIVDGASSGEYISSIKLLKSGLKNSNPLTDDDIKYFDDLIVRLLNNAYENIRQAKFEIAPKVTDKDNSCSFCKMKDICYKKYDDEIKLLRKEFKVKEENKNAI